MASNFESSIHGGSDLFFDYSCFYCQENDRNTEAEFYCDKCSKLFCGQCVDLHNTFFKKHSTLGKGNISKWPETNVDALEQCKEHKKEKLTGFCEDHNELICHACHINNHQKCSHVILIADKVKDLHQKGDFKQLTETLDILNGQLIQKKDDFDERMKSLKKSYSTILEEINALRKQINASLDELENNTVKELNTLLATMKMSIQTDIKHCTESIKNIKCVQEDWLRRKDKSDAVNLIMYGKFLDESLKTKAVLQATTAKNEKTLTFNADTTIQQTLSTLSGLGQILSQVKQSQAAESTTQNTVTRQGKTKPGNLFPIQHWRTSDVTKPSVIFDPNQVIRVKSRKSYAWKADKDADKDDKSYIVSGICETATGELLIADCFKNCIKLLDQTYKVVAYCDLPSFPMSMCSIDSSQVAVALYRRDVQFIRVINGQLVKDRIMELQHACLSIAHQHGNLYITDGKALYHYTVDVRLVSKIYENTSVSPDGDRIYVINEDSDQLITLSRDGRVISKLKDRELNSRKQCSMPGLHVTYLGQVLVCGDSCNTIIQVDKDGKKRLAEVVTKKDGVTDPLSVYYSKHTGSLIVGMWENDNIMVFKVQ